jgi:hypothetical protein
MTGPGNPGSPLVRTLGIKPASTVALLGAPERFEDQLEDLPADVTFRTQARGRLDMVITFHSARDQFERRLPAILTAMERTGVLWVAWPEQATTIPTDMSADVVREVVLPIGLIDVRAGAVAEGWSGLKVVWRKSHR